MVVTPLSTTTTGNSDATATTAASAWLRQVVTTATASRATKTVNGQRKPVYSVIRSGTAARTAAGTGQRRATRGAAASTSAASASRAGPACWNANEEPNL